jgi:hypothetical protein
MKISTFLYRVFELIIGCSLVYLIWKDPFGDIRPLQPTSSVTSLFNDMSGDKKNIEKHGTASTTNAEPTSVSPKDRSARSSKRRSKSKEWMGLSWPEFGPGGPGSNPTQAQDGKKIELDDLSKATGDISADNSSSYAQISLKNDRVRTNTEGM